MNKLFEDVRASFPVLNKLHNGKPLIYLDSAATALKPAVVAEAVARYYRDYGVNIHRGPYRLSQELTDQYEIVREQTAAFINAQTIQQIVFTKNCTESINIISRSLAQTYLKPGDEILISPLEHHANLIPWQVAARQSGAVLRFLPLTPQGVIEQNWHEKGRKQSAKQTEQLKKNQASTETDETSVPAIIDPDFIDPNGEASLLENRIINEGPYINQKTKVVAITGMSNITGYMPPITEIINRAKEAGALTIIDGAQLAGHSPVDVAGLGCDFFSFSAHKLCGPTGVGILYGDKPVLEQLLPGNYGGGMISKVRLDSSRYADLPARLEGGTPNIEGVLGFGAALKFLSEIGMSSIMSHEKHLAKLFREKSTQVPGFELYGPADPELCGGIVSFGIEGVHPHDIATLLDDEGIAVRAGFHCARPFIDHLDVIGTVRASFHIYNSPREIDILIEVLKKVYDLFTL